MMQCYPNPNPTRGDNESFSITARIYGALIVKLAALNRLGLNRPSIGRRTPTTCFHDPSRAL